MNEEPWVVLMPPSGVLVLSWLTWEPGAQIMCHLAQPDDAVLRQRVTTLLLTRRPCPCFVYHPGEQQWYQGEVYVADINVTGTTLLAIGDVVQRCVVMLVPDGPLLVTDALPRTVLRLGDARDDTGCQFRMPAASLAVPVKE